MKDTNGPAVRVMQQHRGSTVGNNDDIVAYEVGSGFDNSRIQRQLMYGSEDFIILPICPTCLSHTQHTKWIYAQRDTMNLGSYRKYTTARTKFFICKHCRRSSVKLALKPGSVNGVSYVFEHETYAKAFAEINGTSVTPVRRADVLHRLGYLTDYGPMVSHWLRVLAGWTVLAIIVATVVFLL